MWQSYTALKGLIEQKDAVINQLYSQLSELQEKYRNAQLGTGTHHVSGVFASAAALNKGSRTDTQTNTRDMHIIADREFNLADQDGDGRISREEWRKWIEDKHNLIQEHNQVKAMLMEEIKVLRKSLTPMSEQAFDELKRSEELRRRQEEELIRVHIANDDLRDDLATVTANLRESEIERAHVESDWQERFAALQRELEETKKTLSETQEKLTEATASRERNSPVVESQPTHGYGYPAFSPVQFHQSRFPPQSAFTPYSYNVPEDRVLSTTNSIMQQSQQLSGQGDFGALDLQTIANSETILSENNNSGAQAMNILNSPIFNANPGMLMLQQQMLLNQQQQQQLQQAAMFLASSNNSLQFSHGSQHNVLHQQLSHQHQSHTPMQQFAPTAEQRRSFTQASPLLDPTQNQRDDIRASTPAAEEGSGYLSGNYEFRSPDDEDDFRHHQHGAYTSSGNNGIGFLHQQDSQPPMTQDDLHHHSDDNDVYNEAKGDSYHHHHHQTQHQPHQQIISSNTSFSNGQLNLPQYQYQQNQTSVMTSPTPASNSLPQLLGSRQDHPLRNALRNEVRHKNNPLALLAVTPTGSSGGGGFGRSSSRRSPDHFRSDSPPRGGFNNTMTTAASGISGGYRPRHSLTTPTTPKTPLATPGVNTFQDDGRVAVGASGGRGGSPHRFMQGTTAWKKKATNTVGSTSQPEVVLRASTWR